MKRKIIIILITIAISAFTIPKSTKKDPVKKYLPVYIGLPDSTNFQKDLLLWFKPAFKRHNIKVISKNEVTELVEAEVRNNLLTYQQAGGALTNTEKVRDYLDTNAQPVANMLTIKIQLDKDGYLAEPITWLHAIAPPKMGIFNKPVYHALQLDSGCTTDFQQLTQCITDSIVASGLLLKE